MKYTFDHRKAALNLAKHGVLFEAAEDFEWEFAMVDVVLVGQESRLVSTGLLKERVHVLIVTLRGNDVRIISLRRANRKEVERYVASQN